MAKKLFIILFNMKKYNLIKFLKYNIVLAVMPFDTST